MISVENFRNFGYFYVGKSSGPAGALESKKAAK
jgi:hypothetical protein